MTDDTQQTNETDGQSDAPAAPDAKEVKAEEDGAKDAVNPGECQDEPPQEVQEPAAAQPEGDAGNDQPAAEAVPETPKEVPPEPDSRLSAIQGQADAIRATLDELSKALDGGLQKLQESFDSKLRYDAKKDAIIDRQAGELEEFKKGLIEKSTLSFAQDLISEVDSAEKLSRYYDAAEFSEENYRKLRKALKDTALSLCDILEKYGILAYRTEPGEPFNARRQRARLTTKTGDAALDKTVKALLGAGFEQEREDGAGTKVLRPELVDVYVYDPALAPPAAETKPTEKPEEELAKPAAAEVPPQQEPLS